jgi:hypothetical protein
MIRHRCAAGLSSFDFTPWEIALIDLDQRCGNAIEHNPDN